MKIPHVRQLYPGDFAGWQMTKEEFIHLLELFDAFWQYRGEPRAKAPHAMLTNGLHSNGFVDTLQVLKRRPTSARSSQKKP